MQLPSSAVIATLFLSTAFAVPNFIQLAGRNASSALTTEATEDYYCTANLNYCGWNLINNFEDDYQSRISAKLCSLGITCDPSSPDIWNSLWGCGSDLEFVAICGGANTCADGGAGVSDYCV